MTSLKNVDIYKYIQFIYNRYNSIRVHVNLLESDRETVKDIQFGTTLWFFYILCGGLKYLKLQQTLFTRNV